MITRDLDVTHKIHYRGEQSPEGWRGICGTIAVQYAEPGYYHLVTCRRCCKILVPLLVPDPPPPCDSDHIP